MTWPQYRRRCCSFNGQEYRLTILEIEVLFFLLVNRGTYRKIDELVTFVYQHPDYEPQCGRNNLYVIMSRISKKLKVKKLTQTSRRLGTKLVERLELVH